MAGAKSPPTSLPAHPADARYMIARSNPAFDAVCMARELVTRIGDEAATKITRETSVQSCYTAEQIRSHGEDFLKMVLARIAFTNAVRNFAVEWAKRNCKNRNRMQKILSSATPHDLFRVEDLQRNPRPVLDAALLYLQDTFKQYMLQAPGSLLNVPQRPNFRPSCEEPSQASYKASNVYHASVSVPRQIDAQSPVDPAISLHGPPNRHGPYTLINHARRDGFPMRRVVSEPPSTNFSAHNTSFYGPPPILSSQKRRNTRTQSNNFYQPPQHSQGENSHIPPFYPEQLAPTLHGQMLRNNLAQFHGIPIMHISQGNMPTLTPFVPAGAFAVHPAIAHAAGPAVSFTKPYLAMDPHNAPREHSENIRSHQYRSDKGHGPKRTQENKPPTHAGQWRVKQSPPAQSFPEALSASAGLGELPVDQRITKDSIGADIEHIFKLWVHGIPQSAAVAEVQHFFEETVAVSAIKPIKTDIHNFNYTYVTFHSTEDARRALRLNGGELNGQRLLVQVCHSDINYGNDSPRKGSYSATRMRKLSRASTHSPVDLKNQGSFSPQDARSGDFHKGSGVASGASTGQITRPVTPEPSPSKKTRKGNKRFGPNVAQSSAPETPDMASTTLLHSVSQSEKEQDLNKHPHRAEGSNDTLKKEEPSQSPQDMHEISIVNLTGKRAVDKGSNCLETYDVSATQEFLEPTKPTVDSSTGNEPKSIAAEPQSESHEPITTLDLIEHPPQPESILASQVMQTASQVEQTALESLTSTEKVVSLTNNLDTSHCRPPTDGSDVYKSEHSAGEARVASPLQAIPEATEPDTEDTSLGTSADRVGDGTKSVVQAAVPPVAAEPRLETAADKTSSKKNGPAQTESLNPFAAMAKAKKAEAAAKRKEKKKAKISSNPKTGGLSDITNRENLASHSYDTKPAGPDHSAISEDNHSSSGDKSFLGVAEAGKLVGELVEPFRQYSAPSMQNQWDRSRVTPAHDRNMSPGSPLSSSMTKKSRIMTRRGMAPSAPSMQHTTMLLALGPKATSTPSQLSNDHFNHQQGAGGLESVCLDSRATPTLRNKNDNATPTLTNESHSVAWGAAPVTTVDCAAPMVDINDTCNSSVSSIRETEADQISSQRFDTSPPARRLVTRRSHIVEAAPSRSIRRKRKKKDEHDRPRHTLRLIRDERSSSPPTTQSTEHRFKLADFENRQRAKMMLMRSLREQEYLRQLQKHLKARDKQLARSLAIHLALFRKWREENVTLQQPFTLAVTQYSDEVSRHSLNKVLSGEINRGVRDAGFAHPRDLAQMQSETRLLVQEEILSIKEKYQALSDEDFRNEARREASLAESFRNDERLGKEQSEKARVRLMLRQLNFVRMEADDRPESWAAAPDDHINAYPPSGEYHGLGLGEERLPLPKYDISAARRAGSIKETGNMAAPDWDFDFSDNDTLEALSAACDDTDPSVVLLGHPGTSG